METSLVFVNLRSQLEMALLVTVRIIAAVHVSVIYILHVVSSRPMSVTSM